MKWMKITKVFTLILLVIIAVFDGWIMAKGGTEASISHLIITASYKYPMIPFLLGILCGHLFWRMRYTKYTKEISDSTRQWSKEVEKPSKEWDSILKKYKE